MYDRTGAWMEKTLTKGQPFDPKLEAEALERFRKNHSRCGTCLKHIRKGKEHPVSFWDTRGPRYKIKYFCSGRCLHNWARMGD